MIDAAQLSAFAVRLRASVATADEASRRCSTSKIYYAKFHVLVEFLQTCGIRTGRCHSQHKLHAEILIESAAQIRTVNQHGHDVYELGQLVRDLHWLRVDADYKLNLDFTQLMRDRAFYKAQKIDQLLAKFTVGGGPSPDIRKILRDGVISGKLKFGGNWTQIDLDP